MRLAVFTLSTGPPAGRSPGRGLHSPGSLLPWTSVECAFCAFARGCIRFSPRLGGSTMDSPGARYSQPKELKELTPERRNGLRVRSRGWVFVINNYWELHTERLKALLEDDRVELLSCGYEVGESGTPHIQGYVYWRQPASGITMVKALTTHAFVEVAKGTAKQNFKYTQKDANVCFVKGEPQLQGARHDICAVRQALESGASWRDITVNHAFNGQCLTIAKAWLGANERRRDWKPEVRWYVGQPGSGKTKSAMEWLGDDVYVKQGGGLKWWCGYDAHDDVLIDDFRCTDLESFVSLLGLLDRYPYRVENKGGSRQFLPRRIAITSVLRPEECFSKVSEDKAQLLRRIDCIYTVISDVFSDYNPDEKIISSVRTNADSSTDSPSDPPASDSDAVCCSAGNCASRSATTGAGDLPAACQESYEHGSWACSEACSESSDSTICFYQRSVSDELFEQDYGDWSSDVDRAKVYGFDPGEPSEACLPLERC